MSLLEQRLSALGESSVAGRYQYTVQNKLQFQDGRILFKVSSETHMLRSPTSAFLSDYIL
jgi:hypothetical protein